MSQTEMKRPNPRRVEAGKENRKKRGPLTQEGRVRLREAALRDQPWIRSTGPRTMAGKAQAARNGKKRQQGSKSVREIRAEIGDVRALINDAVQRRKLAAR